MIVEVPIWRAQGRIDSLLPKKMYYFYFSLERVDLCILLNQPTWAATSLKKPEPPCSDNF